jgi:hypothetical protein
MTKRGFVPALAAVALLVACGGPYKGKSDRLPKGPKKVQAPPDAVVAAPDIKYVDECSAKFTDDPMKAKRSSSKAKTHIDPGNDLLAQAGSSKDPALQINNIVMAIEEYKKALVEDHYSPEATYELAVAYAAVRKKGCALKMLKRLGDLSTNPKLAGGPTNLEAYLSQVEDEPAFRPFKNDAMQAIGR